MLAAVDVDDGSLWRGRREHFLRLLAEMAATTRIEQDLHAECTIDRIGAIDNTMSKVPEYPQSIDDFLKVVRASGLVAEADLSRTTQPWLAEAGPLPETLPAALIEAGLLTSWQVEQLRKGKHKGFMLGKYRLLRLLGAGGMSSVYLGENTTLRQKVAIKVLPIKRVDQSSYLARFQREAQAAFRLSHQNIARAFDLDVAGAVHFIVMEYVEGTDLHGKVKQEGPLDVRDAAEYIRQAAVGLHYAHEEGFVHRDIKPANLMLDRRGTVKILDLGLALGDDDEQASLTRDHDEKVLGTADYLAPEQARDSHKADRRADIYSLGCTLHYLLVGRAPFAKGKLAERIRAHLNEPAPNLLETRPDVPAAIVELYFRMMEKHPDARQQTALEVATALESWLSASGDGKPRDRIDPPRRQPPRRNPGSGVGSQTPPPRRTGPSSVVLRSGAGSGSGSGSGTGPGRVSRSGIGSGNAGRRAVTAPVKSTADRLTLPVGAPASAGGPGPAATRPATPAATGFLDSLSSKQIAGLPLGFWIFVAATVLVAIGLGLMLALRSLGR